MSSLGCKILNKHLIFVKKAHLYDQIFGRSKKKTYFCTRNIRIIMFEREKIKNRIKSNVSTLTSTSFLAIVLIYF